MYVTLVVLAAVSVIFGEQTQNHKLNFYILETTALTLVH